MKLLNAAAETTLSGAINASQTTLTINAVAGSPTHTPFRIWIDAEMMIVRTRVGANYSNVLRGAEGTTASAHDDDAMVIYPLVPTSGPVTAAAVFELTARGGTASSGAVSTACITFIIDGGSSAITTGIKGDLEIPFGCTIQAWTLLADQSGAIKIDVWKDVYANYPPDNSDSITNGNEPEIVASDTDAQDTTLNNWTTVTITAGDTLRFNVDSCTSIKRVTLSLKVSKT